MKPSKAKNLVWCEVCERHVGAMNTAAVRHGHGQDYHDKPQPWKVTSHYRPDGRRCRGSGIAVHPNQVMPA